MPKNGKLLYLVEKLSITKKLVDSNDTLNNSKIIERANILKYERRHVKMSNNSLNTQPEPQSKLMDITQPELSRQPVREKIFDIKLIITTVTSSILTAIIIGIAAFVIDTIKSPSLEIEKINESIDSININYVKMETNYNNLKDIVSNLQEKAYSPVDTDVITEKLIPTQLITNSVDISISKKEVSMPINLSVNPLQDTDVIAKDITGNEYTVEQLVNQKLLLPYKSNGQEVYFYGQLNENNQWHGRCIINVYKDKELIIITDATYNNGVVQSYKQVLPMEQSGLWIISDRQNRGDYNSGESWQYSIDEKEVVSKSFNIETVSSIDILTVDKFRDLLKTQLEGYYYGNTSEGKYNDSTGTSYMIKYDAFGKIRTLYCGNFKNGKFDDNTGNAWYITRDDEINTDYMYYKGNFCDGAPSNNSGYEFKNNLTLDEINSYMEGKVFNADINWALIN